MIESELPSNEKDLRDFAPASQDRMKSPARSKDRANGSQEVESQVL